MSTPQDTPNHQGDGQGWNPPGGSGGFQNPYRQPGQDGQPDQHGRGHDAQQSPYGYPSGQTSGYAYPTGGADLDAGTGKGPIPQEVMRAYYLILAAGALYLISTIASLFTTEVPDMAGASLGVGLGLFVAVIATAAYVVLAVFIKKGQNWARITATVLAGLNVLSTLSTFLLLPLADQVAEASGQPIPETPALTIAVSVIVMLLGVAGVVMTYLKPARPYFAPRQLGY